MQLYLDTDYILPIAVGADGNVVKYHSNQGECRLWLYFSKTTGLDRYTSGSAEKANYEAKREGYYGDFWNNLKEGGNVGREPFPYIELLEVGGLLNELRNWCKPVLGTATPAVVLNFATTIEIEARRIFIDYLTKKGFNIRSYSVEMNNLVAEKVAYDHRSTWNIAFGDQLMVLQSTGKKILLATMTWCGNQFMQGEKPDELEKQGDDFKKAALAEMVVKKMEQYYNMLNPSDMPSEIAYQTQFAEDWLKSREGDSIRITGFHYSNDPAQPYPSIQIDAHQLDLLVKANGSDTTKKIAKYHEYNIVNNHLHTIFFGDVFNDESFLQQCIDVTSSKNKFTFFNDNALQEAMGRYYYSYGDLTEPVNELEKRYLTMEQERERIRKYVKNAEKLGSLRTAIENSGKAVSNAIANLKSRTASIEDSWTDFMKVSKFDEAEKVLGAMASDAALTSALGELFDAVSSVEASTSLLTDLKQLNEVHVREIVEGIEKGFERLLQLQKEAKGLEVRPEELRELTQHYRNEYSTYKKYKQQFQECQTTGAMRRVLAEMEGQDLTMEPLPEIQDETTEAEFTCQVETKRSGLFGMKKEHSVKVELQVKDEAGLPFPCVVMIANSQKVSLDRNAWCADLHKGDTHWEKVIPVSDLPQGNKFVAHLFPNEDNAFKRNNIYCESKQIKIE